jgi:N-acetylneuraminic acid mutarotase
VHDAAGAVLAGTHFVFGGGAAATVATAQTFNRDGDARVVGKLPAPRSDLSAAVVGSTVYILGGYDGSSLDPRIIATVDGVRFSVVATLPVAVRYAAVASLGANVYVFGGEHDSTPTDAIQRFDTRTRQVDVVGHLRQPVAHAAAVVLHGRIYVLGGVAGKQPVAAIRRFDPVAETVAPAGGLPYPVSDAGAAVVGDTAYLVGGEAPRRLATVIAMHALDVVS